MSDNQQPNPEGRSVTRAIQEFKENENSIAAHLIVQRFESRILGLAQKQARKNAKTKNEAEDIAYISFGKMFEQLRTNQNLIDKHIDSDGLWAILCRIVKTTTVDRVRYYYSEKRGGAGRLDPDQSQIAPHLELDRQRIVKRDEQGNELSFDQFVDENQVDEDAKEFASRLLQFIESLDDPILREIAKSKSGNESNSAIGDRLGVSRESVRRKWELIKNLAAEQFGSEFS